MSPSYSKPSNRRASERITQHPGEKALFYILCDPVDWVRSHVAHAAKRGRWSEKFRSRHIREMTDVSRYAEQIARFEASGLRPILLAFNDLRFNAQRFVDTITDALGLDRLLVTRVPHRHRSQPVTHIISEADLEAIWADLSENVEVLAIRYGFDPARSWQDGRQGGEARHVAGFENT